MPTPVPSPLRRNGFTLVELLAAMALAVIVTAILGVLIQSVLTARDGQTDRLQGPVAARAALRTLSREVACAFAPPVKDLPPLQLTTSTEPGKPDLQLVLYAPVPAEPAFPHGYDLHQITYEVHRVEQGRRELRRIATPSSGPFADTPATNRLLQGRFHLSIEAVSESADHAEWPPSGESAPSLPGSLRLSLSWNDAPAFETEVLIQAAHGIRSPIAREAPGQGRDD